MRNVKERDRVRVTRGDHEGRTGTVVVLSSSPYAEYLKIGPGHVQVGLDGEPAQVASGPGARAAGGRGGIPIIIPIEDLEPYEGPAGIAVPKTKET